VAINAQGLMAGNWTTASGDRHCFFWNPNNGVMNDVGLLPGGTWCRVVDINSQNNTIAGTAETSTGNAHAFMWRQATGIIDLGTLGGPNPPRRGIERGHSIPVRSKGWTDLDKRRLAPSNRASSYRLFITKEN
jgi:probable HAF family extracellular repeat protein